jgi:hypothetical protein
MTSPFCQPQDDVAVALARLAHTPEPGQIATLILPADTQWLQADRSAPALPKPTPAIPSAEAIDTSYKGRQIPYWRRLFPSGSSVTRSKFNVPTLC